MPDRKRFFSIEAFPNHDDDVQHIIKIVISWNPKLKTDLNKGDKVCHQCFIDVTILVLVSPQDSNGLRLRSGGAKGPGLFFIVPCIDQYRFSCTTYNRSFWKAKHMRCNYEPIIIITILLSLIIRIIHLGSSRQRQRQRMIIVIRCVDLRTGAFDVPPQEILTRSDI